MRNKNASLLFIFVTILIDVIGVGIVIPVMPGLVSQLAHVSISEASFYSGWLLFAYASMQFVFSPTMGSLSDRFGRRPVLLFSLLGLGVDYLIMAFAPDITWLFVGRIFAGIMGASFTTAAAYIADISPPEKRAQSFGMVGVAFGVGFIIGPLLGSIFCKWGLRVPFYFASSLSLINFLYGLFILPESLAPENRRAWDIKRANPLGALHQISKYPVVKAFILPLVLLYIAQHAVHSNWNYYTMYKFKWDESEVGFSLAFVGVVVALVQGGLIRIAIPKLGNAKAVIYGMTFTAAGYLLFAFAGKSWMMYAIVVPYALGGIAGPAIQGIMSNQTPPDSQGELQGIMTSLLSLTSVIGPLLMNYIFGIFTTGKSFVVFPGAPMLTAAALSLVAVVVVSRSLSGIKTS